MPAQPRAILLAHVRRRRASFVLTSLIDVIFLLVIFFMVSSQIVPFSLIGLGPIAGEGKADASDEAAPAAKPAVAVRIFSGEARIAGAAIPFDALPSAFADLRSTGVTALIVIPTRTATVQDMVTVLEAVKAAAIETVTVLNSRGTP